MPAEARAAPRNDFDGVLDSLRVRVRRLIFEPEEVVSADGNGYVRTSDGPEREYGAYRRGRLDERDQKRQKQRSAHMSRAVIAVATVIIAVILAIFLYRAVTVDGSILAKERSPASKADVLPAEKKPAGRGRVTQTLTEWAKLTDACLLEKSALSTSHAVRGCFAGEDGKVHCTHDTFEDIADECRTKANASGRPKGVFR